MTLHDGLWTLIVFGVGLELLFVLAWLVEAAQRWREERRDPPWGKGF